MVGRIFNSDYEKQGQDLSTNIELDSDIYSPVFNFRLEFRDLIFSPTSTLLIKLYTLESHTKTLCVVGYAAFNIFAEARTARQPANDLVANYHLNEGAHQLRLYRCRPPPLFLGRLGHALRHPGLWPAAAPGRTRPSRSR